MRILVIKRAAPVSTANGLDLPVLEILRRLTARHEVLLACWTAPAVAGEDLGFRTAVRPLPSRERAQCGNSAPAPLDRLLKHYGFLPATGPWLAGLIQEWRPDVVVGVDYPTLAALAGNSGCPRVAYLIDNQFLAARQDLLNGNTPRLRALKELIWSWRLHRRYGAAADTFVFVTEREAAGFRRFTRRPCRVVTNGVDVERFRPNGTGRDDNVVVFVGTLDFPPNVDAAQWFCHHVWPQVRGPCPDATFRIVGRNPVARVRALGRCAQVEVIADPPDVRPYLAQAAAAVAPMRSGGGVKNKVLEAWAMGTAVVATRMSVAGLAARAGENIALADGPPDFATNVVRCLRDRAWRERIGAAARNTVLAKHTWDYVAGQFEGCLAEVGRPGATASDTVG